jgi:hypothetical protein
MVEHYRLEFADEGRFYETPHVLVATETMGKDHAPFARSANMHVIPFNYAH